MSEGVFERANDRHRLSLMDADVGRAGSASPLAAGCCHEQ